ncbi:MAG: MarR family winged helix-turn-helix transcriptional regulator [Monoglobales bacterium]
MNRNMKEQLEMIIQQLKELDGVYRRAVSHTGISENEFWIWYTLIALEGEYSQQDICTLWSLSKQTVNTIVSNMVQKNFATLEVVPGTRNRKKIHLTESGKEYGEKMIMPVYDAERRAIVRLSPEELDACIVSLGKFISILKEEIDDGEA